MKRFFIMILAILLVCPVVNGVEASNLGFKDLPKEKGFWAEKEVDYLIKQGIISGYADGTFRPNEPITRAQVAGMMVQALKLSVKERPNPGFKDVSPKSYYYQAIAAVAAEGIIRGDEEGRFRPGEYVTRAQMAAILRRAMGYKQEWNQRFLDIEKTHWAFSEINSIAENGITWGKGQFQFVPNDWTSRAQFSVFLARALNGKMSLYPYYQGINSGKLQSEVELGKWKLSLTEDALLARHVESNEVITIVDKERIAFWLKIDLKYQLNKNLDDLTVELDKGANFGVGAIPIIIRGSAFNGPIRSYLQLLVDPKLLDDPKADLKFHEYYSFPFESFDYSKFNFHSIMTNRFLGNVRSAGNGDVKVSLYVRSGPIHTPPKVLTDIVIRNDRVENGQKDAAMRDFRSFAVDGSRMFYYNSQGLYSRYYDGSQQKQLVKGSVRSFKIDGLKIKVEMANGKVVEVDYPRP
ncbi:S-layer homology domain-containing protein [Pseudoneobacillus sp. C159]